MLYRRWRAWSGLAGSARGGARSAFLVLARVEPARGLGDDLVSVNRHPQFEPGVTGIVLGGRPHGQPVRAVAGADADQVEGLRALAGLGRGVVLEQHERGPVPAGELGPDLPADSVTEAAEPVWVTTTRWPGSRPAVSHTRR
jgi:hypothetical protein